MKRRIFNKATWVLLFSRDELLQELRHRSLALGKEYNIPPYVLIALARAENSQLDPSLTGQFGERGIFQLRPIALKDVTNRTQRSFDPTDPFQAIEAAAIYWSICRNYNTTLRMDTSDQAILITWNRGIGNAHDAFLALGPEAFLNPNNHPEPTRRLLENFNFYLEEERQAFENGLYEP